MRAACESQIVYHRVHTSSLFLWPGCVKQIYFALPLSENIVSELDIFVYRLLVIVIVDLRVDITMDPNSFENIKRAVEAQHFKDEKLDAIRTSLSCSYGYLSADQVAQLVREFSFDDERLKTVEICAPRLYSMTCEQAASILGVFSFDKSKTKALEVIARHITDNNLAALDSVLSFSSDRDRAREILMNRTPSGPQPGPPPQPGAGGFPGMPPQPGGFPGMAPQPGGFPAPYPGAPPFPGQSPYGPGSYGGGGYPGAAPPQYPTGAAPLPGAPFGVPPQGGYCPPPAGYPQMGYPYQPPR